jgi:hypothetical protein
MRAQRHHPSHSGSRLPRAAAAVAWGALVLLPLRATGAQAARSAGATRTATSAARATRTATSAARATRHREALYVGGAASGVLANALWRYHAGSRVGADAWLGRDKALHAGAASSLTFAGIRAGVRPWVAATTVCVTGGAFELTQVRSSGKDASVNCLSAATAWAGSTLFRRWTSARR